MVSYTRIQAHSVYDCTGVKTLHLGVCVQFIEETYAQCQIGVGEQFHGLGLGGSHIKGINILLDGSLLQQVCKCVCGLLQTLYVFIESNDDSGGIEVVIQSLTLTQELGGEYDIGYNHFHGAVLQTLAV